MRLAKITISLSLLITLLTFWSCVKEEPVVVPDVYVDFKINLQFYTHLFAPGNAIVYPNEGYDNNGIIIYRLNLEEFFAYDATCPQHINISTAVALDDDPSNANCPHCETTYSFLNFGQASKGHPLKRYNVKVYNSAGNITLHIYN